MNDFPDNRRTIVSFLLSALLNNISKVKDGYRLFAGEKSNKALLLVDLAFFMYAFSPSFDSTRKLISLIAYMNDEVNFSDKSSKNNGKLENTIRRYSFIFQRGNLPDICDWFPFFAEFGISLDAVTESMIIAHAESDNNPITWANILLYSKYYESFYNEVKCKIEKIVDSQISRMSSGDPMMQVEFWYVLIFHNSPHISNTLQSKINAIISEIQVKATNHTGPSSEATLLICDFLNRSSPSGNKPLESFYDWNENRSISEQITYRTLQRTIFKKYRGNRYGLFASID